MPSRRGRDPVGGMIVLGVILLVILLIAVVGFLFCTTTVDAGNVGVGDVFGSVSANEFGPGLHVKNPLEKVVMYDAKTQKYEADDIYGLTIDGMQVNVHVTVNYRIDGSKANEIRSGIAGDYRDTVVIPEIRGVIYTETGKWTAEQLYKERNVLERPAKDLLTNHLTSRGVIIESVIIRSVIPPEKLKQAIEAKMTMEQETGQKKNEVEKEKYEAERKRVEAEGTAAANRIVAESLTDPLLRNYLIQALKENPNVVYIPSDLNLVKTV